MNTFERPKVSSFGLETRPKPGEPFVLVFRSEFWIALQDRSMAVASTPLVAAPLAERPPWAKGKRAPQFNGEPWHCVAAADEDTWLCRADGKVRSGAELRHLAKAARNHSRDGTILSATHQARRDRL